MPEEDIPCIGITQILADDFQYANMLGSTIKPLGVARVTPDGAIAACVSAHIVPKTNQLSRASMQTNCIALTSTNLGTCYYSGPGAGGAATANSVVSDMVAVAQSSGPNEPFPLQSEATISKDFYGRFYVRFMIQEGLGIIRDVGAAAAECNVSIHSILQTPVEDPARMPFVVVTDGGLLSEVQAMCSKVEKLPFCLEPAMVMPILDEAVSSAV